MIGAAMTTDRPIVRAGSRHSPATMAVYSKPPRAPNPILPKMFRFSRVNAGSASEKGWTGGSVPMK